MKRRTFLGAALATLALPAVAQQSILSVPAGTPVLASDGAFVGVVRSRARTVKRGLRLFINPRRSRVFRRLHNDVLIDLPADKVKITQSGLVIDASTQTLRNRLQYNKFRGDEAGGGDARVFL